MKTASTIPIVILMLLSCSGPNQNEQKVDSDTEIEMSIDQIKAAVTSGAGSLVNDSVQITIEASAKDQVKLILRGGDGCGSRLGCGKYEYLKNISSDKRIRATVKTSWIYNNQRNSETLVYDTDPGVEIFLGCTAWCSSYGGRQDFKRSIVGATYLN